MCLKLRLESLARERGLRLTSYRLSPSVRRYVLSLDWEQVSFSEALRSARWFTTLREVEVALTC